jgi:hypothetical protein
MSVEVPDGVYTDGLYRHAIAARDTSGRMFFRLPERLPYQDREDTIVHICTGKERVIDIALLYFKEMNPLKHWEIIATFQPNTPIRDPFVPLRADAEVHIPSIAYVREVAFADSLADYPEL